MGPEILQVSDPILKFATSRANQDLFPRRRCTEHGGAIEAPGEDISVSLQARHPQSSLLDIFNNKVHAILNDGMTAEAGGEPCTQGLHSRVSDSVLKNRRAAGAGLAARSHRNHAVSQPPKPSGFAATETTQLASRERSRSLGR